MTTATGPDVPHYLTFDDNALAAALYGERDRHLARIEQQLGVQVTPRGNRVALQGPASEAAAGVLTHLYGRLKSGLRIGPADVDAALRLAGDDGAVTLEIRTAKRRIAPRSPGQARYLQALEACELVFALGPAGTGKTYLAVATAVAMMEAGRVDRIVLSRPAVEAGERLGFLPGDVREKVDPYLRPLYDALYDTMPAARADRRLAAGDIEVAPLAFMRGRTLASAFVILDEAQNTTPVQMKMFLTRLGEGARMAVTGDPSQVDLPAGETSGLADALRVIDSVAGVACVQLGGEDVVRHELVSRIVAAYGDRDGPPRR